MFNNYLFKRLEEKFQPTDMVVFSEIITEMYKLLYDDVVENSFTEFTEYDFEQEWWNEKHKQLINKV